MENFILDDEVECIERIISQERFERYVKWAGGDKKKAIRIYERNTLVSEAFYTPIQGLEIALRNAVHNVLAEEINERWFDPRFKVLVGKEEKMIGDAKNKLKERGKTVEPGRVVAELSFGFWTALTEKRYVDSLWIPYLHKAFPNHKISHKECREKLRQIRILRNRIAHHEPILEWDYCKNYQNIIEIIGWIDEVSALWVQKNTNTNVLSRRDCYDVPLKYSENSAKMTV